MADHLQTQLERAIVIATEAHAGQVDKAGAPYILHPLRLMMQLDSKNRKVIAMLHDVLEDTQVTEEDLRLEGIDDYYVNAVVRLSREPGTSYSEYIEGLSHWDDVKAVKIADLQDNLQITRLMHVDLTQRDLDRIKKYQKALRFLL